MQFRCPNCLHQIRILGESEDPDQTLDTVVCPSCNSRFSLSSDDAPTVISETGKKIAHFEIQEVLGEGAFGVVYKAWDTELRRPVAIKIPRHSDTNAQASKLVLREAQAASGIKHSNVVAVYEVGPFGNSYYIACEYIEGVSLSEFLKIRVLSEREICQIILQILRAVQFVHEKGIIHRDLKPGNILIDGDQSPHIADFGLARHENPNELTVTHDGKIIGTLNYMPPEQARGDVRGLSNRSDVYAIGAILYEMLTGQKLFSATSSRSLIYAILNDEPKNPRSLNPKVSKDMAVICLKALEKDTERRYASAGEMAEDISRLLEGRPISARPVSPVERAVRWAKRNRAVVAMGSVTVFAILTASRLLLSQGRPARIPTTDVRIECRRSDKEPVKAEDVRWSIYPLARRTRLPDTDHAVHIQKQATISVVLPAGEYLVVVDVAGYGFHEVYRYIPDDINQKYRSPYNHRNWSVNSDGSLQWPDVTVFSEVAVTGNMEKIPAGSFVMGDDKPDRPAHQKQVSSFWVDPTEVSFQEFGKFESIPADVPKEVQADDNAVVMVTWHAATAYAEAVGKRLLREEEYEFLASNLGTSKFPNGDTAAVHGAWTYGPVGTPVEDRMANHAVFGLYSNVAEWTDSLWNYYPGQIDRGEEFEPIMHRLDNRVVRGGPVTIGPNDRSSDTYSDPVTARTSFDANMRDTEIGFRCARSFAPLNRMPKN